MQMVDAVVFFALKCSLMLSSSPVVAVVITSFMYTETVTGGGNRKQSCSRTEATFSKTIKNQGIKIPVENISDPTKPELCI